MVSGCGADEPARSTTAGDIGAVLDRRAAAVLHHDTEAYLAGTAPGARALREAQRTELANLADVPLSSWTYEVREVTGKGAGRATAEVELRYRIKGFDTAPLTTRRTMELTRDGSRWYLTADRPAKGAAEQLWQQGEVAVVRGSHALVLGVGRTGAELRAIRDDADRAVPAVSAAWQRTWAGRIVVLVPRSVEDMGALLASSADSYRGIAAVTTGGVGGTGEPPALADRVIVNPEAYAGLTPFGRRVVLTHETTHVATRPRTSAATPLWLSEGFADWAAYRAEDRDAEVIAPELAEAVRAREAPAALPADADFAFDGEADALAQAYEGGWLACAMIADRWGEEKLTAFYRAVGAHHGRDGAVEQALSEVLSTTEADFTADWRDYVRDRLGRA
ncbi:hypothetical protein [uncultured Streptomyces sp.]|uniref:hypothetical protein n=1 Tax=uncultured Streptomyces sp. TaxID=174707 RepID=UPI00263A1298|nr:hypothetical protein [uncultured Streptomyces sp.]